MKLKNLKRQEELWKLQMSNTKRYFYSIWSGVTPYFNEMELSDQLSKIGVNKLSALHDWILWKGFAYNFMLFSEIEISIKNIKKTVHISDSKIENSIIKGQMLYEEDKQKASSIIRVTKPILSMKKLDKKKKSTYKISQVQQFLSNAKTFWS